MSGSLTFQLVHNELQAGVLRQRVLALSEGVLRVSQSGGFALTTIAYADRLDAT